MPPISEPESALERTASIDAALAQVAAVLPDAILLLDASWRIVYANAAALASMTIPAERLIGTSLWNLYPALVGTEVERVYREAAEQKQPRRIEAFYYSPTERWSEVSIFPAEGGGVAVYCRDITSMKRTEAARTAADDELRQLLEATTDAVLSIDQAARITYINRNAMKMLAVDGNILGTNVWESFPRILYEGSPFFENYHRVVQDGVASFEGYCPAPLNLWLQVSVKPSKDGVIILFRDITQEKRATEALMQTEKLAAVGRLASSIAHEINNPLEAVTNLIYLARLDARRPEMQAHLDMAEQELRRVSLIANQTLRFHKQSTRPQAIGCEELFTTVLDMYEGKLKNSGIAVEKRKRAHLPAICFEGEIRQVLNNLVGNAIDAMPNGGRLLARSREATDWKTGRAGLVLTVADTGSGIDRATLARMFDAFFTTKGDGGTGLGLWVSGEIVKRHQGQLRVRSSQRQPHRGTVLTLFLPFQADLFDGRQHA